MQRGVDVAPAQEGGDFLLDVFGRAFFHHQHGTLAQCKFGNLLGHQRESDVEHQHRNVALAKRIGRAKLLQRTDQRVVQAALHDDAQIAVLAGVQLVEALLDDVAPRCGDALLDLELFLAEGHGRVRELVVVEGRRLGHQRAGGYLGRLVVLALETAAHMASANAQLQDGRHVGGFREAKAVLHHAHHIAEFRPRVEQQHGGLERVGVGALLDHAGAFTKVFTDHDQRPALDTG